MLLSIIIVSYNTKDLTIQTLKSAVADINSSKLLKRKTEIFVVDNRSKDDSVKAVREFKQKTKVPIKVIATRKNLGFAKGNNVAVEKAKGEYIIFLNSDTIIKKGALESMVKRFDNTKLGVLAATLLNTDFTLQAQGGNFPNLLNLFFHMSMMDDLPIIGKLLPSTQHTGKNLKQTNNYKFDKKMSPKKQIFQKNKLIKIDWVAGTAMMLSRKAIDEFGSLDPNIFMYGEDIELCLRARNHNYEVAIDPTAQIIHLKNQSSTSENSIRGELKGYLYIYSKHQSRFQTEIARVLIQMGVFLRIFVFSIIAPDPYKKQIYKNALSDLK
ncbi:glycosyltransferase family 2 protein [Patescibacteria group bacterium]|nr:glycosyltransferase family 2 protein [Patescibacteria group bacterium]